MAQHLSARGRQSTLKRRADRSTQSPYHIVTNKIISALERGVVPWRKPWNTYEAPPCNAISKRPYHGINLLLLGLARYEDHRWLTYKQAKDLGGFVKPGENASMAVFWKPWEVSDEEEATGEVRRRQVSLLRFYNLFNVSQCEGLNLPELERIHLSEHQRIVAAEAFLQEVPDRPKMHKGEKQACYYPLLDVVAMPPFESFISAEAYYCTLLHELAHATGHEKRLNRLGVKVAFGSKAYAREELIAELASAFCCATIGLDNSLIEDCASYIAGWLKALCDDPRAIVVAAAQAQRAADYLQGKPVAPYTEVQVEESAA